MDHKKEELAVAAQEIEDDVQQDMPRDAKCPKQTTKISTPFGSVEYRPDLKLSRASIIQLINCYTYRITNQSVQSGNKWQEFAYPRLQKIFGTLCETFTQQVSELYNAPDSDREVVMINFCGYKSFKLPLIVQTLGVHPQATYISVNVRPFLKTMEQRLMYLANVKMPDRYKDDEKKVSTFNKVQALAENLRTKYVLPLHEAWRKLCQDAADYAGIVVETRDNVRIAPNNRPNVRRLSGRRTRQTADQINKPRRLVSKGKLSQP